VWATQGIFPESLFFLYVSLQNIENTSASAKKNKFYLFCIALGLHYLCNMAGKEKLSNSVLIKNKRASFDFEFIETFTAGIVLTGTEIKSIRLGKASLVDTYCIVERGEIWVKNMYIAEYFYGTYNNHVARRDRKLLLNKKEIRNIESAAKNSGFTIVPTKMFINDKGLAKVVIAIAKGKKEYDKRQSLKERDDKREMNRAFMR